MSASIERCLISRIIDDGSIEKVVESRINEEFFVDDEHRLVWQWLLEHWTKYSQVPSEQALRANYPAWRLAEVPEPIDYYIDQMRHRRMYTIAQEALLLATDALQEDDPQAALKHYALGTQTAYAQVSPLKNDVLTQTGDERLDLWTDLAKHPGRLRGMSTGFRTLDKATRGIQPEQYIVIAGKQKAGKSTILLNSGIHMNEHENAAVLLVSFEMSRQEQWARHDALRAEISYSRLLDGRMTARDKRALRKAIQRMRECNDFVLCSDISATTSVSGVRAQVEQIKPNVVCIDGVYLMEDDRGERAGTPQALTNISRDLKRMAQATGIPVIVTTQILESKISKRQGPTSASVGYTSAFGQDCDAMFIVDPQDDGTSVLSVALSRSGPLARTSIRIDWDAGRIYEIEIGDEDDDSDQSAEENTYF